MDGVEVPEAQRNQSMCDHIAGSPQRISWVDGAKGIGIVLVVIGHVERGLVSSGLLPPSAVVAGVDRWIYSFHMPLFFFLSGLFLVSSSQRELTSFVVEKLRTVAYPFVLWSLLTIALKSQLGELVNHRWELSSIWDLLISPVDQYWFLYVLFLLSLAFCIAMKVGMTPFHVTVVSLSCYPGLLFGASAGWIPLLEMRGSAIYLALGALMSSLVGLRGLERARLDAVIAVVTGALSVVTVALAWHTIGPVAQIVVAISGITAVTALASAMGETELSRFFQFLGRYSLEIFVGHVVASAGIRIFLVDLVGVVNVWVHIATGVVFGLAAPIGLALLGERANFPWLFRMPKARGSRIPFGLNRPG